jgi:alpha-D-ribose 1-methylphosphonate 5-triphosphate synthase subunit PhnL
MNDNGIKSTALIEEGSVRLPEVAENLISQLDSSRVVFRAVQTIGKIIKEDKMIAPSKRQLEIVMRELLDAGKALSNGAYNTAEVFSDLKVEHRLYVVSDHENNEQTAEGVEGY